MMLHFAERNTFSLSLYYFLLYGSNTNCYNFFARCKQTARMKYFLLHGSNSMTLGFSHIWFISRNLKTFERSFTNHLTRNVPVVCFISLNLKLLRFRFQNFHFQKGLKFSRLAKIFGNVFQISEVEYVAVMPIVSNKWNS